MKYKELMENLAGEFSTFGLDVDVDFNKVRKILTRQQYGEQKFYKFKELPIVNSDEQVLVWYGKNFCGRTRKGVQPTEEILLKLICDDCGFYIAEVKSCFDSAVSCLVKKVVL